jgi:UDP-glucuronate decarboxylase
MHLTVYGDGSQTRSFCYVEDTIRGLQVMMEKEEANGEIINIGNPVEHTVLQVAQMVIRLSDSRSGISFMPLPQDDPKVHRPDITKAKTVLGWQPEVSLEEGLRRTDCTTWSRFGESYVLPAGNNTRLTM